EIMNSTSPETWKGVAGTSNIAAWRCSGSMIEGEIEIAAPLMKINDVMDHVEDGNVAAWMTKPSDARFPQPAFALTIPISGLKCSGGRPMEADLRRVLKSERHPSIDFRYRELRGAI